jgi:hypothetical protein
MAVTANFDYFPKEERSFYWRKCALCTVGIEFLNSQGCSERMENIIKTKQKQDPCEWDNGPL